MTLKSWADNGWLRPHRTSPQEIADLLAIVERDVVEYEMAGVTTAQDAAELTGFAEELRQNVTAWLQRTHPGLLPSEAEN